MPRITFAYQQLRLDASLFQVAAYIEDSPRWDIVPDPDGKLPHLAFVHTTGRIVKAPLSGGDPLERLMGVVMEIAALEVHWAPDATDRDRAAVVVYLTGIMQELRPEPSVRRLRPRQRAEGNPASEGCTPRGSDDLLHQALAYIRVLTRMEPTPAEREAADQHCYPDTLPCHTCAYDGMEVERPVTALGPVINPADPTRTYKLACGHTTF
jgi:hypothetical protein